MEDKIETKFGNANLNEWGYYRICSVKEGNYGKYLHRLIFEDFYQCDLNELFPDGIHVHHVDGNPTNNEIWNLDLMTPSEHTTFHKTGTKFSEESIQKMRDTHLGKTLGDEQKLKISEKVGSSGVYRVSIQYGDCYKQGFTYRYCYPVDGKLKTYSSVDLNKLKKRIISMGLPWIEHEN